MCVCLCVRVCVILYICAEEHNFAAEFVCTTLSARWLSSLHYNKKKQKRNKQEKPITTTKTIVSLWTKVTKEGGKTPCCHSDSEQDLLLQINPVYWHLLYTFVLNDDSLAKFSLSLSLCLLQ